MRSMWWVRIPLGAFDFFPEFVLFILDRHNRVDLTDDEQYYFQVSLNVRVVLYMAKINNIP